jgi:glycosyltransferase involved in cell wall biosynthesis
VISLPLALLAVSAGFCLYPYVGYPAALSLLTLRRRRRPASGGPREWPRISIVLPVHNEAGVIAATLERLLALDYPAARRQIVVVSDASTDGTDEIVTRFAGRGVELLRLPERRGKTGAENAARRRLRGEIVVNTDAAGRIHSAALRRLVAAFDDPTVGVASGCDVSVADLEARANAGEEAYVGYEMWLRDLETHAGGIVGASGCLYAIRAALHQRDVPEAMSRDFAAALTAHRYGFRAVSVRGAVCVVPRGVSPRQEYRRRVRTFTRGLVTLAHERALLNPLRHGAFAWMLFSHKLCRWLVPWAGLALLAALAALSPVAAWARAALLVAGALVALGVLAWCWPRRRPVPRLLALPAAVVAGSVAVLHAWLRVASGRLAPVWEPTRRGPVTSLPGRKA